MFLGLAKDNDYRSRSAHCAHEENTSNLVFFAQSATGKHEEDLRNSRLFSLLIQILF